MNEQQQRIHDTYFQNSDLIGLFCNHPRLDVFAGSASSGTTQIDGKDVLHSTYALRMRTDVLDAKLHLNCKLDIKANGINKVYYTSVGDIAFNYGNGYAQFEMDNFFDVRNTVSDQNQLVPQGKTPIQYDANYEMMFSVPGYGIATRVPVTMANVEDFLEISLAEIKLLEDHKKFNSYIANLLTVRSIEKNLNKFKIPYQRSMLLLGSKFSM